MTERRKEIAAKAAQTIPQKRITQENLIESVQLLYDLLGASKLGKESEDSVWLCGVRLTAQNNSPTEEKNG